MFPQSCKSDGIQGECEGDGEGWIKEMVKGKGGWGGQGLRVCHFKGECWEATGFK